MLSEPRWLAPEDVIDFCRKAVARTREPYLLHRSDLLRSALARPVNHWYYGENDIGVLAALLLLGIAMNHPFEQGNKRAALMSAMVFLRINGYRVDTDDYYYLADIVRAAVERTITDGEFVAIFRELVVPR